MNTTRFFSQRLAGLVAAVVLLVLAVGNVGNTAQGTLIGHWTFDDTTNPYIDSSGNGNNGTASGSPVLGTGVVGSHAMRLNGASHLNVGSNPVLDTQSYTVSAWMNTNNVSSWRGVVGCWSGSNHWAHFGLNTSGQFSNFVYTNSGQQNIIDTSTTVNKDQWYHVASVVDKANKSLQLWVNGSKTVDIPISSWTTTQVPGSRDVYIGTPYGDRYFWDGELDDVAIWNGALGGHAIRAIHELGPQGYNAPQAIAKSSLPVAGGLELWLDASEPGTVIDDGTGHVQQWQDKSGNDYHAASSTADRRPTLSDTGFNGLPTVRFDPTTADGNSDGMAIADSLALGKDHTVFVVNQYYDNADTIGRTLQSRDTNWLMGLWNSETSFYN